MVTMVVTLTLAACIIAVMVLPAATKSVDVSHLVEKRDANMYRLFGDGRYYWHPPGWAPQRYDEEDHDLGAEKNGGEKPDLDTKNNIENELPVEREKRDIVFPGDRQPVWRPEVPRDIQPGRPGSKPNKGVIFPGSRPIYPNFPVRPPTHPNVVPTAPNPSFPPRFPPAPATSGPTEEGIDPAFLEDFGEETTKKFREPVTPGSSSREIEIRGGFSD